MDESWLRRPWFHAIDLGDGRVTPGRFASKIPPNYTLYGFFDLIRHVDLSQATCFDIGTMDGLSSFVLAGLGARRVVACDLACRDNFAWAREQLGYDNIDYRTPVSVQDLPKLVGDDRPDVVVMAGVLYHLYDPLSALVAVRQSLHREGLLIVETIFLRDERAPCMRFNPSDRTKSRLPQSNIYWLPSKAALHGMLELSGFEVLATRIVNARLTVLARAKRPKEIASDHPSIRQALCRRPHPHYRESADFDALQRDAGPEASVRYEGPTDERFLYRAYYEPLVPHQPAWRPPERFSKWHDAARSGGLHAKLRAAEARAAVGDRLRSWKGTARANSSGSESSP